VVSLLADANGRCRVRASARHREGKRTGNGARADVGLAHRPPGPDDTTPVAPGAAVGTSPGTRQADCDDPDSARLARVRRQIEGVLAHVRTTGGRYGDQERETLEDLLKQESKLLTAEPAGQGSDTRPVDPFEWRQVGS
jgi:hypothetical protein